MVLAAPPLPRDGGIWGLQIPDSLVGRRGRNGSPKVELQMDTLVPICTLRTNQTSEAFPVSQGGLEPHASLGGSGQLRRGLSAFLESR